MIVRTPKRRTFRSAFTLTEMLVVVAIIVILAGIAVPITMNVLDGAKRDIAKTTINSTLRPAVERFKMDQENNPGGDLPGSLQDLVNSPKVGLKADQLNDPWGQPYQYSAQSSHGTQEGYDIWSTANGGTPIGNWKN